MIISKILVKAVCKSQGGGAKKDAGCKTFTLRNVDTEQVSTRDQLKHVMIEVSIAGIVALSPRYRH